jgi:Bacterial SH3 domain
MLRRLIFILTAFVLLSGITAADARPYGWTAWLHYGRHMTLVNAAGESLREVDLPAPDGYTIDTLGAGIMAVSHKGDLIAYAPFRPNSDLIHIVIYDSANQTLMLDYIFSAGTEPASLLSNIRFSEDDNLIAFSYIFTHNELTPSAEKRGWGMAVLNILTGKLIYQLSNTQFTTSEPGFSTLDGWEAPIVQSYNDSKITFILIPPVSSGVRGFTWNTLTGEISEDIALLGVHYSVFEPTNEAIGVFSNREDDPHYTLQVYDPIIHARYPFYAGDGWGHSITTAFVQNGERVLIGNSGSSLTLVERNGQTIDQWNVSDYFVINTAQGIPDGFLYTAFIDHSPVAGDELGIPILAAVNTRDNQLDFGQPLWHLSFQEFRARAKVDSPLLEIVWEHDDAPRGPYIPWAQLAPPVYELTPAGTLPPPTMIPTPEPLFQISMTVHVQTTGGEILNLRSDHTRTADVIMYLKDNTPLTLLEGPVESEGYTWWRVRTPDGVEGWTVANNGELQTLVPR